MATATMKATANDYGQEKGVGGRRCQSIPNLSTSSPEEAQLHSCSSDLSAQIQKPQRKAGARMRPVPKAITESAVHIGTSQASSPKSVQSTSPSSELTRTDAAASPSLPDNGIGNGVKLATDRQAGYGVAHLQAQTCKVQTQSTNGGYSHSDLLHSNPHCSISTDADPNAEIRTKVFRMGAPLLRSTIPVSLGRSQTKDSLCNSSARNPVVDGDNIEDEDVETVLSLSDVEGDDHGSLAVTLDFPC